MFAALAKVVKETLQEIDPSLQTVLPGMLGTVGAVFRMSLELLDEQLYEGAGESIDVINMHWYDRWDELPQAIDNTTALMAKYNISDKPLLLTEVGASNVAGDQPPHLPSDSPDNQAADVWRYFSIAFAHGVSAVHWHTYWSSGTQSTGWGGFGLVNPNATHDPAYEAYALWASTFPTLTIATALAEDQGEDGLWAFRVQSAWVLWVSSSSSSTVNLSQLDPGHKVSSVDVTDVVTQAKKTGVPPARVPVSWVPVLVTVTGGEE